MGWFEQLDPVHRITSINQRQAQVDADGRVRIVIAQQDPGGPNWLDTSGHPEGLLTFRWFWPRSDPSPRRVSCGAWKSPRSARGLPERLRGGPPGEIRARIAASGVALPVLRGADELEAAPEARVGHRDQRGPDPADRGGGALPLDRDALLAEARARLGLSDGGMADSGTRSFRPTR